MVVQSTTPFVGRDTELALLSGLVDDVVAGRGRAVLIEGEPGIGKSALLTAALATAEPSGCKVLRGACEELTQRFPLWAPAQALGADGLSDAPGRTPVPGEDPVLAAIGQLAELVDRLCAAGPLVLAVEDLHWADEPSLRLWERLSRATARLPLLLVATRRPVPVRTELDGLRQDMHASGGVIVTLDGLPESAATRLAAGRLGGAPGPRLARVLASAARNPLYLGDLLDALARSDALRTTAEGAREVTDPRGETDLPGATEPSGDTVPWPVGAIADRLDFLSDRTRDTLRTAALLGPDFTVAELATVAGQPPDIVSGTLDEALAARVVEADGTRLRFRHGLIRRSLHETMPSALRAALSQHAAKALIAVGAPVERVAALLPDTADAEGWETGWIVANAATLAARAPGSAARLLAHAGTRLDITDPRYADIEDHLLAVTFRLGRDEQAERTARDILARDTERGGRATWFLGSTLLRTGRREEAATVLADARTAVPLWRARVGALRSTALAALGDAEEAGQAAERAHTEGLRLGDPVTTAQALYTRSVLRTLSGDLAGALATTDEILSLTHEGDENHENHENAEYGAWTDALAGLRLAVLGDRAAVLTELDRFPEAEGAAREALARAARDVRPAAVGVLRTRIAELRYVQGRWDEALLELEPEPELEPGAADADLVRPPGAAHALRALIAGQRDDWPEAARSLAALGDRRVLDERVVGSAVLLRARALEAEHVAGPERVVEVLARCLTPESGPSVIDTSGCLPTLVRSARECGDPALSRVAAQVRAVAADGGRHPARRADLDWCRGLLAGESAPVLAAASYYRAHGRPPVLGNALEDAAVLQAADGEATAARATLAEALEVYSALGAVRDARRATARLRPYGVRPGVRGTRQRPKNGRQALTGTELRVAELVGQGLTNPEIAGRLLLSRRTVETHVSRILTKLQISSRREVVRHVGPEDA
ncbi:helix-turn-helix transcriptional regulator [Streptomyces sp. NPDC002306]